MAKHLTPIKSIRAKCLDCTGNQPKEIRLCSITKCPLFDYRFGHRPKKTLDSPIFSDKTNAGDTL